EAEGAHGRTAARGIKREKRVQQERNVVARGVEVALVDFRDPGKLVELFDGRRLRVVDDLPVFAEAGAGDFFERLAVRVVADLVVEFAADDEVDGGAGVERLFR